MSEPTKFGKFLRIVGLILLSLTAIFHLMGGIGTTCVALGAEKYDSMAGIIPFKWLNQLFVVVTIAIAVYAIRATIRFARSKPYCIIGGRKTLNPIPQKPSASPFC